jgi:NAD(P)-dependent dehydrogenase (short-subunit alcohol dehydrogenase family)
MQTQARIVLVTGASRGIGAEVAQQLASPDTHVIVNCREDTYSANAVAEAIRRAGGHASTMVADIYDEAASVAMVDEIGRCFGRLDLLVLNASGGCGHESGLGDARRSSREAQRRIARLALPLMPTDGHVVFVTSHQAHFYPHNAVPKGYATIAASMRAGETALHAMRAEFDHRGVHFTVVSGEMIDGTTIVDLLKRRNTANSAPRGGHVELPTVNDFAVAIANAATSSSPGGIVFVGGPDYLTPSR